MMLTTKIQNKIIVLVNSSVPLKLSLSPSDAAYHQNSIEEIDEIDQKNRCHQQPKTNKKLNNKTQYLRLRLYDSDFIAFIAF